MTEPEASTGRAVGLLLAAGSGSRMGQPKALVTDGDGVTWLTRALAVLRDGGCRPLYVVVGASADAVGHEAPADAHVIVAGDWAEGMGASLRAGLLALAGEEAEVTAAVVMLVDTPGVTPAVVKRVLAQGCEPQVLGRSSYQGIPGHPVVIGRAHWDGVAQMAHGDRGARDYLDVNSVSLVECGDLGSGGDIDTPEDLASAELHRSGRHDVPHSDSPTFGGVTSSRCGKSKNRLRRPEPPMRGM